MGTEDKELSPDHIYAEDQKEESILSDTLQELPSYVSRGLIYLIILFACIALAWSVVSQIDIISSVNSKLVPGGMLKITQPDVYGKIEEIIIKEGQIIKKGQTLVTFNSQTKNGMPPYSLIIEAGFYDTHKSLEMTLKLKNIKKKIQIEDYSFVLIKQKHSNNLKKQDELVKQAILEVEAARSDLIHQDYQLNANKELFKEGLISKFSFVESERKRDEALFRLKKSKSVVASAKETREITDREFEEGKNEHKKTLQVFEEQLDQIKFAMAHLESEPEQNEDESIPLPRDMEEQDLTLKQYPTYGNEDISISGEGVNYPVQITSPIDGTVKQLMVRSKGEAVTPGQTLMFIAPSDLSLIAELKIPNKDIGKVKTGQVVRFKFDAFPSVEYGAINGELISILNFPEIEGKDGMPYYRAIATLGQDYFRVKENEVKLVSGMTAKAEIITDQKSLFSLFLKPIIGLRKTKEAQK